MGSNSNSSFWLCMVFEIGIKGRHPILIHVWMCKPQNLLFCSKNWISFSFFTSKNIDQSLSRWSGGLPPRQLVCRYLGSEGGVHAATTRYNAEAIQSVDADVVLTALSNTKRRFLKDPARAARERRRREIPPSPRTQRSSTTQRTPISTLPTN